MPHPPQATLQLQEQTRFAEDLKLLTGFVADMTVVWMKLFQFAFEGVDI